MTAGQTTAATEADSGFEQHRKSARRDPLLAAMEHVVPWTQLCAQIGPVYPKGQKSSGRRLSVDATIRQAPSSTKNQDGKRAPEFRINETPISSTLSIWRQSGNDYCPGFLDCFAAWHKRGQVDVWEKRGGASRPGLFDRPHD